MRRLTFLGCLALVSLVLALAGCGSAEELPPPAEPAESPPLAEEPLGRVIAVGNQPEGLAADPETGLVAVGLREPDLLALVDGSTGKVEREVELEESPRHLQLAAPGGPVLVPAERADALIEVSLPDGDVETTTPVGNFPHDATASGERAFVANEFGDSVSVVEDGRVVETLPAPVQPGGIAAISGATTMIEDDRVGVVAVRGNALRVYDASTLETIGEVGAGAGPTHVVADPVEERFWVADTRGDAVLFTAKTEELQLVDRVNTPGSPYGIALDPRARRLWVTLTATNEVAEIDLTLKNPAIINKYPTVRQPNSVAVDSSTGRVFVAGAAEGELQIIDPSDRRSAE